MLGRWDKGLSDQSSDCPSIIFFIISYKLRALKSCKEFCKKLWRKNNTWNIRRLVDESFVPAIQRPSVLCWRLSDFKCRRFLLLLLSWQNCLVLWPVLNWTRLAVSWAVFEKKYKYQSFSDTIFFYIRNWSTYICKMFYNTISRFNFLFLFLGKNLDFFPIDEMHQKLRLVFWLFRSRSTRC